MQASLFTLVVDNKYPLGVSRYPLLFVALHECENGMQGTTLAPPLRATVAICFVLQSVLFIVRPMCCLSC